MTPLENSQYREHSLKSFWVVLEFRLTGELYNVGDGELKGFSCEGIYLSHTDNQLQLSPLSDHQKIQLSAWLGVDGQDKYDATIHFGPKALSLYAQNLPLEDSIPEYVDNEQWFEIDTKKKTIEIQLK
ncbi:MAG: hypothetical protein NXI10_13195 [bacterium]|nr:hypothetical protein [bacterium]